MNETMNETINDTMSAEGESKLYLCAALGHLCLLLLDRILPQTCSKQAEAARKLVLHSRGKHQALEECAGLEYTPSGRQHMARDSTCQAGLHIAEETRTPTPPPPSSIACRRQQTLVRRDGTAEILPLTVKPPSLRDTPLRDLLERHHTSSQAAPAPLKGTPRTKKQYRTPDSARPSSTFVSFRSISKHLVSAENQVGLRHHAPLALVTYSATLWKVNGRYIQEERRSKEAGDQHTGTWSPCRTLARSRGADARPDSPARCENSDGA